MPPLISAQLSLKYHSDSVYRDGALVPVPSVQISANDAFNIWWLPRVPYWLRSTLHMQRTRALPSSYFYQSNVALKSAVCRRRSRHSYWATDCEQQLISASCWNLWPNMNNRHEPRLVLHLKQPNQHSGGKLFKQQVNVPVNFTLVHLDVAVLLSPTNQTLPAAVF